MSRNTGTKTKKCLVFQFYRVVRKVSTLAGLLVPVTRSLRDQVTGIDRPSSGHSLLVLRALDAHFVGRFLGTILSKQIVVFLYLVDYNFVFSFDASW